MTDYNGWTNYETWKLALNLDNDEFWYGDIRRLANRAGDKFDGDYLKTYLEEAIEFESVGYKLCDFWSYNEWEEIDFDEVADSIKAELVEDDEDEKLED